MQVLVVSGAVAGRKTLRAVDGSQEESLPGRPPWAYRQEWQELHAIADASSRT
jgi:hypothetical protein